MCNVANVPVNALKWVEDLDEFDKGFIKACVCYFSLFLRDKCISSLFRTKYIEKKFNWQLFFLPTVSRTFFLSSATMHYPPPWNFLFRKSNCICNRDNVRDVAACPDEWSTKRSEPNKPRANQDKHRERSSNFCYTLNPWEHMPLNIKSNEVFLKKYLLVETFSSNN